MTTVIAAVAAASTLVAAAAVTLPARDLDTVGRAIPTFRLTGHVTNMYPGRVVLLRARIVNPYGFPIDVRMVRAMVKAAPTCVARNLRIRPWKGHLTLAPHRHGAVSLKATMPSTAPATCQGARFPIVFAGRAVRT